MTSRIHVVFGLAILSLSFAVIAGCGSDEPEKKDKKPDSEAKAKPSDEKEKDDEPQRLGVTSPPADNTVTPPADRPASEGTPLTPQPGEVTEGGKTIKAELCAIDGKQFVFKKKLSYLRNIEVVGDKLVVLDTDWKLHGFIIGEGGVKLTVDPTFGDQGVLSLPNTVECISRDADGRIVASRGFTGNSYLIEDGQVATQYNTPGQVKMHSSGKWGLACRLFKREVKLVNFTDDGCTVEDYAMPGMDPTNEDQSLFKRVEHLSIVGDQIFAAGELKLEDESKRHLMIVAFDKSGAEAFRFGNEDFKAKDGFAAVSSIGLCDTGLCVLDFNIRRLTLWSPKGEFVAMVDLSRLFGLSYPSISDFSIADDGSAYFVATQKRNDSEVRDGFIYRVTGL